MNLDTRQLRSQAFRPSVVLVTGASGYVGGLIAAQLLEDGIPRLILTVRPASRERLLERLTIELAALGQNLAHVEHRIRLIDWPGSDVEQDDDWSKDLDDEDIEEIVHCAGCLDYFDQTSLDAVNVRLTQHLLEMGRRWGISRFTYISTAYSAGYVDGQIAEELAAEPDRDPTHYTRSKRRAEWLVADSGLPWLVLRPAILIGEYDSGRYSGKRYGLYQQWMGLERLITDRYHPVIHTVAPRQSLNLVHQDSFQDGFSSAHRWLPDGAVCHLVSRDGTAPTMRDLWDLWLKVVNPQRIYYYPRFEDVDLRGIDIRQRAYLTFAQVNLEIGAHPWSFARGWLDALIEKGLEFNDTSLESVSRCQDRFVSTSDALARYSERFADRFPHQVITEEVFDDVAKANP